MRPVNFRAVLLAGLISLPAPAFAAAKAYNAIAVVLDSSGSFKKRIPKAIEQVQNLTKGMEAQQAGARHWAASDRLVLIAMDSLPSVIFEGTVADLAKAKDVDWARRFTGRSDLAGCTDLPRALALAKAELDEGAPTKRYLMTFSDLVSEPPVGGPNACAPAQRIPGDDFDWTVFSDVSFTAFWLPADQALGWDRALRAHKLTAFKLLTDSESAVQPADIPPPAKHEISDAEKQAASEKVRGFLKSVGGAFALAATAFLGWVLLAARPRNRRRPGPPRLSTAAPRLPNTNRGGRA